MGRKEDITIWDLEARVQMLEAKMEGIREFLCELRDTKGDLYYNQGKVKHAAHKAILCLIADDKDCIKNPPQRKGKGGTIGGDRDSVSLD